MVKCMLGLGLGLNIAKNPTLVPNANAKLN